MAVKRRPQPKDVTEELDLQGAEEEFDQDEAPVEDEIAEEQEPNQRLRRSSKARAPRRLAATPAGRQRSPRRTSPGRRKPAQRPLFSRISSEKISQNATRAGSSILISLLALGLLILIFQFFAGSRFFSLRGIDVRWRPVEGDKLLSADEVATIVQPLVKRGVLNADLIEIRQELKKFPLIREAEVGRLLPDRLRVTIVERQPTALARRADGSVVCVDDEGVMFGDNNYWRGKPPLPLINGLVESGENADEKNKAAQKNRQLVMMYKRLLAELDQSEPPLSSRVDEVYFDEDEGVRLRLIDSRVAVLIGREDFRARLNAALDVLDAVRRKDAEALNVLRIGDAERLLGGAKIAYLNATDPKRVIVGLDE